MNALLDHGSGGAAVLLAAAVVCLFWTPVFPHLPTAYAATAVPPPGSEVPVHPLAGLLQAATRFVIPAGFTPVAILLAVFLPVSIAIIAQWDGLGSTSVIVRRDYMPLVATTLSAWAAVYAPVAAVRWTAGVQPGRLAGIAGHLWFLGLATIAVGTVMGTSRARAAVALLAAWCTSVLVLTAAGIWAPLMYYLTSPWVLYLLYRGGGLELASLTTGLSGRQALKRTLEAAAINPRDSDAQYQLGLIYAQRRNFVQARAHFQKAIDIDPGSAESHYELGRIHTRQGRHAEARGCFERAAALDDKLASSEVWRELGAASLKLGDTAAATAAFDKYTARRPWDPEGLVYYGNALRLADRPDDARVCFERAVEAVRTSPAHRRSQLERWQREAEAALKKVC